ncbi:variable surface lipoprotein [Mycoplasma enhydrae]|uniref:variable surface lipoprotein n=1 Tax=Mycoplasma enhydrae TaxID=2499220 RepID=UPI00197BF612|nr:variable surface lipoprotein [Mycoplasma enhydrae]MBN4089216.1 variable surface lipoprotein [Mycoplasma enhydrae]MCV3733873.1 variable surface lipoprotein [Mycoplasma enhydrae]MCV3753660.1 variable surface lipoprotein [Mycoplasma enhydrae]
MKKTTKLIIGLSSISTLTLPLIALSCSNPKTKLETEIKAAKQKADTFVFADDFRDKYNLEIKKAEDSLKKEGITKQEIQKIYDEFKQNLKTITTKNTETVNKYNENSKSVEKKFNEVKEFAAVGLKDNKYSELKKKLVHDYKEFEKKTSKMLSHEYNDTITKQYTKELNDLLEKYKTEKAKIA